MNIFITILFTLFISSGILGETPTKRCQRLICVIKNNSPKNFIPKRVKIELCTHLIYDYALLEGNILKNVFPDEISIKGKSGLYTKFNGLKKKNPKLLTILRASVPWAQQFKAFSEMASTKTNREEFITTSIDYLRKYKFDGLDIVWFYPSRTTGKTEDIYRAADLIKETFEAFDNESLVTRRRRLLLSMTVHPTMTSTYNMPILKRYTDMVNVICFKIRGLWDSKMEHHSTMDDFISVIKHDWGKTGIPLDKLNIGMTFYGMYAHVKDKNNPKPGGTIVNVGENALYTPASSGYLTYPEICKLIYDKNKVYRDEKKRVPHYFNDGLWLGYDDPLSLTEKAKYAAQQGVGVYIEYMATDDYNATKCQSGEYPLLRAVFNGCNL